MAKKQTQPQQDPSQMLDDILSGIECPPDPEWVTDMLEQNATKLKVKKLRPDAIIPQYQTAGAACFDLHALNDGRVRDATVFDTGLAFEVPEDHVMLLFSRSGHGFKNNVRMANCVGVIDSDYRGEVRVKLTADEGSMNVYKGDRIAQALILPVPCVVLVEVDELTETVRGEGGYGSTGA